MTQKKTQGVVDELLRERHEEVEADQAEEADYQSRSEGPMTASQFDLRLEALVVKTRQRQAARQASHRENKSRVQAA